MQIKVLAVISLYIFKLQINYSSFRKLWWKNKSFLPVFGSKWLGFFKYKLPTSENNLSECTEDGSAERYLVANWRDVGIFTCLSSTSIRLQLLLLECWKNILKIITTNKSFRWLLCGRLWFWTVDMWESHNIDEAHVGCSFWPPFAAAFQHSRDLYIYY